MPSKMTFNLPVVPSPLAFSLGSQFTWPTKTLRSDIEDLKSRFQARGSQLIARFRWIRQSQTESCCSFRAESRTE